MAGFEPAANGSLQTTAEAASPTVHSSTRLLKERRNVALLSYTPGLAWSLQYLVKRITAWYHVVFAE